MKRGFWFLQGTFLLVLGVAFCGGCGPSSGPAASNPPPQPETGMTGTGLPVAPTQPPPPPPVITPTAPPSELVPSAESTPPPALPALPDPPATPGETVKADVGVGQAGRSLDNETGPVVYAAKAYFAVREKVKFQIEIPGAYKLYRAENDAPLTFDEFKEKVLDPNQIKLPPLPPGHTYEWDPEKEELMVRQPAKP
jgi:hypothetical protein